MGREVRRVPPDWKHPKNKALYDTYRTRRIELEQWKNGFITDHRGGFVKKPSRYEGQPAHVYYGSSNRRLFMPDWEPEECTHLQMYETTTEGTPISPVMATPEELARWLADNNASAFGGMGAPYESWLGTIKAQLAGKPTFTGMVVTNGRQTPGVLLPGGDSEEKR
jgi:hypothetical protein